MTRAVLKISIDHPNPEKKKEGVKIVKDFINALAKLTGEEVKIIEEKEKNE